MDSTQAQQLQADISLLERKRDRLLAESEKAHQGITSVKDVKLLAIQSETAQAQKKRNRLFIEMEKLESTFKPLQDRVEKVKKELDFYEKKIVEAQAALSKIVQERENVILETNKYVSLEYVNIDAYKQNVGQKAVRLYETLEQMKVAVLQQKEQLNNDKKIVEERERQVVLDQENITKQNDVLQATALDLNKREEKIAEHEKKIEQLLSDQQKATDDARRESTRILESVDAIEKRLDMRARKVSHQEVVIIEKLAEIEIREKNIENMQKSLKTKEARLEDRERSLRANIEQFKKGKT